MYKMYCILNIKNLNIYIYICLLCFIHTYMCVYIYISCISIIHNLYYLTVGLHRTT